MKAYLIDPALRKIRPVEIDSTNPDCINTIAGFGPAGFCIGWQWVCGDLLCIGYNSITRPSDYWFRLNRRADRRPYSGNGLVIPSELSSAPALQIDDVLAEISWLSDRKARAWAELEEA